jgi:hypothetical protein
MPKRRRKLLTDAPKREVISDAAMNPPAKTHEAREFHHRQQVAIFAPPRQVA